MKAPRMSDRSRPRIALLLGDVTGIGPEITARVLHDRKLAEAARLVVVGDIRVLEQGMRDAGISFPVTRVETVSAIDWAQPEVPIIDLGNIDPATLPRGEVSAESGRLTGETLAYAVELGQKGEVDAITFAPLNKAAMFAGGWRFPDEHKMFAHLLKHQGYFAEMNVLGNQWMSRVTSHVSLREALDMVTAQSIEDSILLVDRMMRRAGIAAPRIGVAALNPHAGEGGLFGRDEIELIGPTVKKVAAAGIDCRGPFPADTIYIRAFKGEFDGVVSMYHDQGQIATKLQGFNKGVTVTAGLETLFTTPAHGTAFDIVGKGVATTGALESALQLAARLAHRSDKTADLAA
jgi:4-hydroxythreonine-4-phosphate dehydrogenase